MRIEGLKKVKGAFGVTQYVYKGVTIKKAVGSYAHGYEFETVNGKVIASTIAEAVAKINKVVAA